jgi:hypothetical protein
MALQAAFLGFQNSFLLAQEGSLDDEIMTSITSGGLSQFYQSPTVHSEGL